MKEFEKLKKDLNSVNENNLEEIKRVVENIDINNSNFKKWVEIVFGDEVHELNIESVPYLIDELFKSSDKYKFVLGCMLLDSLCERLIFIPTLEYNEINEKKYNVLKSTLVNVCSRVFSSVSDGLYLTVLKFDPRGVLFTPDEKSEFISAVNLKLEMIIEAMSKEIQEHLYYPLEILLDIATYINNKTTKKLVNKISKLPLNESSTIFLLKYNVVNNKEIDEEVAKKLINNEEYLYRLLYVFESINKAYMLPREDIKQIDVAKSCMIDWLKYPTELGKVPDEIIYVDTFERDNILYYIFKFKSDVFKERGYMLGVSGGFYKDTITTYHAEDTFSCFETIKRDYLTQAKNMLDMLNERTEQLNEEVKEW